MQLDTFAQRMRHARDLQRLGSRELARLSSLSPGTISAIEVGERENVGVLTAATIADALGVSRAWLAWGDGPMITR